MTVSSGTSDVLLGVAQHDASALEGLFKARIDNLEASGLDPKTYSLVNIAALIAADAAPASYVFQVAFALESGVSPEEILGLLVALNPTSATSASCRRRRRSPLPSASSSMPSKAEKAVRLPMMRRRPLLRAAAVGGVAYMGAKAGTNKAMQQGAGGRSAPAAPAAPPQRLPHPYPTPATASPTPTAGLAARFGCADRRGIRVGKGQDPRLSSCGSRPRSVSCRLEGAAPGGDLLPRRLDPVESTDPRSACPARGPCRPRRSGRSLTSGGAAARRDH